MVKSTLLNGMVFVLEMPKGKKESMELLIRDYSGKVANYADAVKYVDTKKAKVWVHSPELLY